MINIEESQYIDDKESTVHVVMDLPKSDWMKLENSDAFKKIYDKEINLKVVGNSQEIIREQMIILAKWNSNHDCCDNNYETNTIEQIRQNAETILKLASITGAFEELQKL